MDIHSLTEFYQWVLQKANEKQVVAVSVSNLLVTLYVISYILNRKSCFIVAFFIVEFIGVLSVYDSYGLHTRYIAYGIFYGSMYWFLFFTGYRLKIISGYAIMLLFQIVMAIDAFFYYDTETALWANYEYIVVVIHIYIISTITDYKRLNAITSRFASSVRRFCNIGYSRAFWYNVFKLLNQARPI